MDGGVSVGLGGVVSSGVFVGIGVAVGCGVSVGANVAVGWGIVVAVGARIVVAVGSGALVRSGGTVGSVVASPAQAATVAISANAVKTVHSFVTRISPFLFIRICQAFIDLSMVLLVVCRGKAGCRHSSRGRGK